MAASSNANDQMGRVPPRWESAGAIAISAQAVPAGRPRSIWRSVQQKEAITFHNLKKAQEVILRYQQLALKEAVLQRGHDAVARLVEREFLAQLQVQRILHGGGIGDSWNGAAGLRLFQ